MDHIVGKVFEQTVRAHLRIAPYNAYVKERGGRVLDARASSNQVKSNNETKFSNFKFSIHRAVSSSERSLDTVVRAVSALVLPVWVDFTSLKGLPCAPGPATTRRGMLVTNG